MISERTLRECRKNALQTKLAIKRLAAQSPEGLNTEVLNQGTLADRILRLTQELSDLNLINKR